MIISKETRQIAVLLFPINLDAVGYIKSRICSDILYKDRQILILGINKIPAGLAAEAPIKKTSNHLGVNLYKNNKTKFQIIS